MDQIIYSTPEHDVSHDRSNQDHSAQILDFTVKACKACVGDGVVRSSLILVWKVALSPTLNHLIFCIIKGANFAGKIRSQTNTAMNSASSPA